MGERGAARVDWKEQERVLTLEGEPVLTYTLSWPEIEAGGRAGRRISRYYARLAQSWRDRWERQVYWSACLDLAARREAARPFTPWRGELSGEVALLEDGVLSLRFRGAETRGDGKASRVRWGDLWQVREGRPLPLGELLGGERGWRKRLWAALTRQGEERRQGGDCFLDPDWAEKARPARPLDHGCLTPEGLEVSLPQCLASPAAEGCPVFVLPLREEK